MTEQERQPTNLILADFYKRLETVAPIIRVVLSQARLSALLTFRGAPEKKVLLDFSADPARVLVDDAERDANIIVTIDGEILHDILVSRIKPGLALGRREMLLRGSAADLAKFIPLFDFGPLLYREHLSDIGFDGYARLKSNNANKEEPMQNNFTGQPIPVVIPSVPEKLIFKLINGFAYMAGYVMGALRYRLFKKMSLFSVLSSMSRGLEAATPKKRGQGIGDRGQD